MVFLLGISIAIRQLLDLGSSSAFYTFISQNMRSRRFVAYYFCWMAIQLTLPLIAIWILIPGNWLAVIWKGEARGIAALAFLASFLQNGLWPGVLQIGESKRATRWVQTVGVSVALLHLIVVAVLWQWEILGLHLVFAAIAVEYVAASWVALRRLYFERKAEDDAEESMRIIFHEFAKYCLPLIPYGGLGFAYSFADPWLLQHFGGNTEQAYYGVSAQIAGISVIFAASVQNTLWKEIAEANHRGDTQRITMLYRKVDRILYMISAAIAGFLIPWAEDVLRLLVGADYGRGALVLAIMLIYPVQQTKSHIESTMFFATGRVQMQVITGIWFMLASLIGTYFVLAPGDAAVPGLGLASVGMAAKMVVMQTIQVQVIAIINARYLGIRFDWSYQLVCLGICVLAGIASAMVVSAVFEQTMNAVVRMSGAFVMYLAVIGLAVYAMPGLVASTRASLTDAFRFGRTSSTHDSNLRR